MLTKKMHRVVDPSKPLAMCTFCDLLLETVCATLKIYVLAAQRRMKTRSMPFSCCNRNMEGKAYKMYPT
jgi:hypothetical protein